MIFSGEGLWGTIDAPAGEESRSESSSGSNGANDSHQIPFPETEFWTRIGYEVVVTEDTNNRSTGLFADLGFHLLMYQ